MSHVDLSENVRQLIQSCLPTIDALEILIFLARRSDRAWRPNEIIEEMRPTVITEKALKDSLSLLQSRQVVTERPAGAFIFEPASTEMNEAVSALNTAYNERPVTLIRAVYAIQDLKKIQSFADAFKLKKD